MIDFFATKCKTTTSSDYFGLCDDTAIKPHAFVCTNTDDTTWIAKVENPSKRNIDVIAIDNCIDIRRANKDLAKRCDILLHYDKNLVFVELKEAPKRWMPNGIIQLEKTIEVFKENYNLSTFGKKRAFLANRKHPHFQFSAKKEMQNFRNRTTVRLRIQNIIKIE